MRITLTLDDDVAARLQAQSHQSGRSLEVVVNESLRAGLAQLRGATAAAPFRVEPMNLGAPPPGRDDDRIGALLEAIEGPTYR
jgi:plasmid stability protein